jgi:Glycosyl transferase family 2
VGKLRKIGSTQKIVAICTVRDEGDIIEAFVRHTLAFADHLVVLDNGSTDKTLEILRALVHDCSLPVEVVEDPSPGHWRWKRMTRLLKEFAVGRFGADWVLCLDADEFIDAESPLHFRRSLSLLDGPVAIEWRTYVPHREDDGTEINPVLRIRHRLASEVYQRCKVIVPGSIAGRADIHLGQGNHEVFAGETALVMTTFRGTTLAHFPLRGPEHFAWKVALRALQYAAMYEKDAGWGWELTQYWQTLKDDPQSVLDTYQEAALKYCVPAGVACEGNPLVESPFSYRGGPLSATVRENVSGLLVRRLLGYAEGLAVSYARLHAAFGPDQKDLASSYTALWANHESLVSRYTVLQKDYEKLVSGRTGHLLPVFRALWRRARSISRRLRA